MGVPKLGGFIQVGGLFIHSFIRGVIPLVLYIYLAMASPGVYNHTPIIQDIVVP